MSEKEEVDTKSLSEAKNAREEHQEDSEETQSDEVGGSEHDDADKSDNEEVSSSNEKHPEDVKQDSDQETDGDTPEKNTLSHSSDKDLSDDEPLVLFSLPSLISTKIMIFTVGYPGNFRVSIQPSFLTSGNDQISEVLTLPRAGNVDPIH